MASFKDYEATTTATINLFHGESLQVRSVSSREFTLAALPLHREITKKEKLTDDESTRYNVSLAFCMIESWTFDDELTLDNFFEMLQSPAYAPIAGEICKRIDSAGCNLDSFVKKKSIGLLSGSEATGNSTALSEKTESQDDKRSKRSKSKQV